MGLTRKIRRANEKRARKAPLVEPFPGATGVLRSLLDVVLLEVGETLNHFGPGTKARRNPNLPHEWLLEEDGELVATIRMANRGTQEYGPFTFTNFDLTVEVPGGDVDEDWPENDEVPF